MRSTNRFWNILKGNWDTILIMIIAGGIILLSFFQSLDQQVISTAILSVLGLISLNLLISREANVRLKETAERLLTKIERPSPDEVILPYKHWVDDIETKLASAKEVWLVSRTCATFWDDHRDNLKKVLKKKGSSIRLMLVDPSNGALRMIANSAKFTRERDLNKSQFPRVTIENGSNPIVRLRERVNEFIEYITNYKLQNPNVNLNLRTIDFLPPFTLVIIDATRQQGMMFVELGTYQSHRRDRPTFTLYKATNQELFTFYLNEFEAMWENARPGDVILSK